MIDALVGHLVADYLMQNDWMAQNKKKRSFPCAVHCFIWATIIMLFAGWPLFVWPVLFITHYIQDRTNIIPWVMSKYQSGFKQEPFAPWSIIVVDNVWHIFTLWLIWKFLTLGIV